MLRTFFNGRDGDVDTRDDIVWALTRTVEPQTEPVTVAEAKAQSRIDTAAEDSLISGYITAVRQHAEYVTRRALVTQTWQLQLDEFPPGDIIRLPRPPLQSVASVEYIDTEGTVNTFAASNYIVDTDSLPGRVVLKDDASWPTADLQSGGAVTITFDAGFGDQASDVPKSLRQAITLLVAHWYEHRESVVVGSTVTEVPQAFDALLGPHRTWWQQP